MTLVRDQLAGDGGATPDVSLSAPGPFITLTRSLWRRLAPAEALPVSEVELEHLRALADVLDRDEARDVYFPLCNLIQLRYASAGRQEAPYNDRPGGQRCRR